MSAAPTFIENPRDITWGLVAEFATPHDLIEGVKAVRKAGFSRVDTHTPFPVHGMDRAMGLPQSKLPWIVLVGALTGTASAALMQWWMNGYDYLIRVGGKPFVSYQSWVPVMFELTVLLGVFATVGGLFGLTGLPKPYHPLFLHGRFRRATDDGFFLSVEATDPKWDEARLRQVVSEAGGQEIAVIKDDYEGVNHG